MTKKARKARNFKLPDEGGLSGFGRGGEGGGDREKETMLRTSQAPSLSVPREERELVWENGLRGTQKIKRTVSSTQTENKSSHLLIGKNDSGGGIKGEPDGLRGRSA